MEIWSARRRPVIPKKTQTTSATGRFQLLVEKKMELVELDKQVVQSKLLQNAKEHEKRMQILELQEEEQRMKVQLLKAQLSNVQ